MPFREPEARYGCVACDEGCYRCDEACDQPIGVSMYAPLRLPDS